MTLFSYEIFDAVAKQGSFNRAAAQLHLTPSAVSHAVASMEEELGFSLFNRGKAGVTMTSYGQSLYPAIRNVLNANEAFRQTVDTVNGLQKGVARVGAFSSVIVSFLPAVLENFKEHYPQIGVEAYQGSYDDVIRWVRNGEVDFGFLSECSCTSDLDFTPLNRDRLMCVVPPGWPKPESGAIRPEQMRDKRFVIQDHSVDADIKRYLKKYELEVQTDCRVNDDASMIAMVEAGFGIALMPELTLTRCPYDVGIYPVDPPEYRVIGMATQRGQAVSPAVAELMQYIYKICSRKSEL